MLYSNVAVDESFFEPLIVDQYAPIDDTTAMAFVIDI
jgi:hypothetical protein